MSKRWIPAAAVGTLLGVAAWKEHKTIQGAMGGGQRADKKFAPGEILLLDSPHTRGLFPPTKVNFRGYYGAEDAVVVQDGRQMTIKVAWLSRIKGQRAKGGRFDVSVYKADQASRFPGEWVVESIDSAARANRREVRPFPTKAKAQAYAKSLRAWKAYQPRGGDLGGGQRASTIDTLKIANKNFDDARHAYDAAPTQANHTAMRTAYAARTRAYKADQAVWDKHAALMSRRLGQRAKTNYRRKNKARSYRHRDTVRAKLLQDEANTKRRREDRKSASEGRRAKRRKPSKRAREEWMRRYDKLMGSPQPPPQGYWDTATYLFNSGISPDEAAAKGNGRRAKKDRVSKCISGKVRGEGWDQRRAVAACLNMNREGRLRSDGSYKRKRAT